jgi:hypothetical protein
MAKAKNRRSRARPVPWSGLTPIDDYEAWRLPAEKASEKASKSVRAARVRATVKLKAYDVISGAVSAGAQSAAVRSFKHTDAPTERDIAEHVEREVMNALCEVLDFDGD